MALKFKLNKDDFLEFVETKKDSLFILGLILLLVIGGWFVYQNTSESEEEIIKKALVQQENRQTDKTQVVVSPSDVVNLLLEKRPHNLYDVERSPFGSPEDQLRMRQEVEKAYQRGVDLFNAGDFEAAIEQFDKVIAMDVTETRISYPIPPSEYKRKAQREYIKNNFDKMLQSAQNDISEGDRFMTATQLQEAEKVYNRANKTLSDAVSADPEGTAIGKDNFQKIQTLQHDVFQKWQTVQTNLLKGELDKGVTQAQQLFGQQDMIALLKSLVNLNQIQARLNQVDPNFSMVAQADRQRLLTLITQIQDRLKTEYSNLTTQAQTQFQQAIQERDIAKSKEAVQIMRMALTTNPQDKTLQDQITSAISKRAELVVQLADEFIVQQEAILKSGDLDKFDAVKRTMFLEELAGLRTMSGTALSSTVKTQIEDREQQLRDKVRKPPLVTEDYDVLSVKQSGNRFSVELLDKTSRTGANKISLLLTEDGKPNSRTGISIKQVDMANGFVILSKPGYSPAKVPLTQNN